jgi:hypothetical protein
MTIYYSISKDIKRAQTGLNRISNLDDYSGLLEEKVNDLINDHLNYVNKWGGSLDFSYSSTSKFPESEKYILIIETDSGLKRI